VKKIITFVAVLMTVLSTIAVAQEKPATPPGPPSSDPVVISAGDVIVRQSEFETAVKTLPAEYQSVAAGPQKRAFAEDYLRMKLLAARGAKEGLDSDPDVIGQLKLMKENIVANAELKQIEKGIKVNDEDLKKVYEVNKNDYEQVTARHILIAFKGSPAAQPGKKELTEDEAKAKAEDIRKQIVAGGDFAELARTQSDDTGSGTRGGDLGAFGHGQMVPEFEKAAFAAKVGEVTPIVRTQFGYHIIKVEKHDSTPFETVKPALERTERQKRVQDALEAMKTESKPTFNETFFAPPKPPAAAATTTPAPADAKKTETKPPTKKP
jgi:peptidyl-prolyl cis-trans isomerase C